MRARSAVLSGLVALSVVGVAVAGVVPRGDGKVHVRAHPHPILGEGERDGETEAEREAGAEREGRGDRPSPTEIAEEQDEESARHAREAWVELAHRTAPGTDWRKVEEQNIRSAIARRGVAPPPPIGEWVERGSTNQAGSMYAVARTTDGASIVAGSSFGGVWKAGLDGTGWTPHGDNVYGGVHHLAVLPPDVAGGPDVMITSPTWGNLVFRSADDGASWSSPGGLPADLVGVRRITVGADDTVWLVAATDLTGLVYRSTDRGQSFQQVLDLEGSWGDVWVPTQRAGEVYAVGAYQVFGSTDNGAHWTGRPSPDVASTGRITGSEATDPPVLYVAPGGFYGGYGAVRLYRSDDGGGSWDRRGVMEDYWEVLTASILDPNLVAYGGVNLYRSNDGGDTFRAVNTWDQYYAQPETKLHADMMAVNVIPEADGTETWYIGCHGGVYDSRTQLQGVRNLSMTGLRVGQYYSVFTNRDDPGEILVGAQDQGLQYADTDPLGEAVFPMEQVTSGDYGHLVSTDGSHDWVFSVYPGFVLVWRGTANPTLDGFDFPPDPVLPYWLPFLAPDPLGDKDAGLFAAGHLWRFSRGGDGSWNWDQFSTRSFTEEPGEFLSAVAFSPVDPTLAWGVSSTGRVFRSESSGESWADIGDGPVGPWLYGSAVVPSHLDRDTVYIGGSGYDGPSVLRSVDNGATFEAWDQGLPPTLVYTLVELSDGTGRLVAGTETGAYVRDPAVGEWVDASAGRAPITQFFSAEVLTTENTVRFATYGRGVWDLRLDPQGEGCFATRDADGDGVTCETDCDDEDATVFPGATESCDGVDSDCDGTAEPDDDADGALACADDCDDQQPLAYPGATEVDCDGIDNDCDGVESCPDPVGGGDDDDDVPSGDEGGGCGCATGTGVGAGFGWALVAAAIGLRRRSVVGPGRGAR
ncbi:MAG: MopE-related protein [Myxococcota bacterium]